MTQRQVEVEADTAPGKRDQSAGLQLPGWHRPRHICGSMAPALGCGEAYSHTCLLRQSGILKLAITGTEQKPIERVDTGTDR